MQIGKVVGTVVSTNKDEKLSSLSFQIVEYVDIDGKPLNNFVVAVDSVGAGVGEIVLVASGSSARLTKTTEGKPVDAIIMAIVDILEIGGTKKYQKV
jgi:microcompartment protein CcmK/EutM